ncbi:MAG: cyanophycinase [Gemmatimonadetes bacterium]|nr:cyanophycinase [Gemmatimonadota bacterium]
MKKTLLFTIALIAVGCAVSDSVSRDGEARTTGRLVIAGGGLQADNSAVYQSIVDARAGDGPLCVVPTASSDPEASMERAVATLTGYGGVGSVKGILISTENPSQAQDPSVVAEVRTCSGFFFTGGSQSRIVDVFLPGGDTTEAYRALWQQWQEGAVVSGSSAGAAMMSRVMIAGGSSADAVTHGVRLPDGDGVHIREGMGFFELGMLDQHFLARGRIGRILVSTLQENSPQIGLGIDENTALVVDGDSAWVVGASGVVVVDGRSVQRTGPSRGLGLRMSLVGAGDLLDLRTLSVQRERTKNPMPVTETSIELPEDPFARWAFLHLMVDLASSSIQEATFALSEANLRVLEDEGFSASMAGPTGGIEGTPAGFSAGPFKVDLLQGSAGN